MIRLTETERQSLQLLLAKLLIEVLGDHEQTCSSETISNESCTVDVLARFVAAIQASMR